MRTRFSILLVLLLAAFFAPLLIQAQQPTGSIQGTITDPSGAVVPDAKITIQSGSTGQQINLSATSSGVYTSGPLLPGQYMVTATGKGFTSGQTTATVKVGGVTTANFTLKLGQASEVVTVESSAVQVNTVQPTVQGVITSQQIEALPNPGRNFLNIAALEPGVQIQDGGNFDPTKNGFSSISFGGRYGRTARITLDGIDVSDETVGTTTQNIPASGIAEFQISQSTLDVSTELTSSGAVNVVTKSGSNSVHGSGFYDFRDQRVGFAAFPGGQNTYYQRNQFGGDIGGPIVKDKLFFYATGERVRQPLNVPLTPESQFAGSIPTTYPAVFKDNTSLGRLDWQIKPNMRMFYRFTYNWNGDVRAYGGTYQPFANRDNTPAHGVGWDFISGNFTHSIRFGYLKFQNHIADAVLGNSGLYNPAGAVPVAIRIGPAGVTSRFGPSRLAPQATFQTNKEIKYDGTKIQGRHILRYGAAVNKILGGGFASFYLYPEIRAGNTPDDIACANATNLATTGLKEPDGTPNPVCPDPIPGATFYPGGAANPLNYITQYALEGNGQGYFTEIPQFDRPAGGQYDTRLGLYIGDTWKVTHNLTLTLGLRYDRDTGRADSDLPAMTCDQIDASVFSILPCSGSQRILDQFGQGLGARVRQPNTNFGPQAGFAWDPSGSGKTVIRGGAGLYFENAVFNNVLFDRPGRLPKGLFWGYQIDGDVGGFRVGDVLNTVAANTAAFQAATIAAGATSNPNFLGENLANGDNSTGNNFIAPNYRTPRSIQMNLGFQHQFGQGVVFSADFIRNVGEHFLLGVDTNHLGDARFFNKIAAQNAIASTNNKFGCGLSFSAAATNCAIAAGAKIGNYADRGLTSGSDINYTSGYPVTAYPANYLFSGFTPDPDHGAAFPGINPLVGENTMLFPIGRSTYTGVQMKLTAQKNNPMRGLSAMNWIVSGAISRFNTDAPSGDQDFINTAVDFNNPTAYTGPGSLDRTFQISIGGSFQIAHHGPMFSTAMHFSSPLATSLFLYNQSRDGEIYFSDITGDGQGGDPIVGTQLGTFGRDVNGAGVNSEINAYNSKYAGQFSPQAQVLIGSGLMTAAQMQSLGAVLDKVQPAAANQFANPWFRAFDLKLTWPVSIGERVKLEPSVGFYNLFNFANFNAINGILYGGDGAANGTATGSDTQRIGPGTGVNTNGAPRQTEFGIRLTF